METREITCIGCPLGCLVTVTLEQGRILEVTGNTCQKGRSYAEKEVKSPMRMVTSTVRVEGGSQKLVPVKTRTEIPKDRIFVCMKEIRELVAAAPVMVGDVLIADVAGTGVAVVAARTVAVRSKQEGNNGL